jgi:hypothetical protein
MNDSQPTLRLFPPPAGGWERLLARRGASNGMQPWLPLVAGCASTMLLLLLLVPPLKLQLPWSGARLVGERSEGIAVRPLGPQRVTPLPTDDPYVRIYWMVGTPAGK